MNHPTHDPLAFYTTGGSLPPDAPSYVRRDADEKLYWRVVNGQFCFILGSRQMGKSSLMAQTARRLRDNGVSVAIVDLTNIGRGDHDAADLWYYGIADEIHRALKLKAKEDLGQWWDHQARLPALQRLTRFLHEVVLANTSGPVVIFVDEIDTTIGLPFADDFFAAIRACHNQRATEPEYRRLTFVLLGVASPSDLISDRMRTPFNIGGRIELSDFTFEEARPLAEGLGVSTIGRANILERILHWTDGHPYLTQNVCQLVADSSPNDITLDQIDHVVRTEFFASGGEPKDSNLQFVGNRLKDRGQTTKELLHLYQQALRGEPVEDDPLSPTHSELKLSGLLKTRVDGMMIVRNRIYEHVFGIEWIEKTWPSDLAIGLAAAAREWDAATIESKSSYLFSGERLSKAREWSRTNRKEVSTTEFLFIESSEDNERQIKEDTINAAKEAAKRHKRNEKVLIFSFLVSAVMTVIAGINFFKATDAKEYAVRAGRISTSRQLAYGSVLERDKDRSLSLLLAAKAFDTEDTFEARSSLLDALRDRPEFSSSLSVPDGSVSSVAFSHDGRILAAGFNGGVELFHPISQSRLPDSPLTMERGSVSSVAFSYDGRRLAAGFNGGVILFDTESRSRLDIPALVMKPGLVRSVAFSPDGETLAAGYGVNFRGLVMFDLKSPPQTPSVPLTVTEGSIWSVAFNSDGRTIAAGYASEGGEGGMVLFDVKSRNRLPSSPVVVKEGHVKSVTFSHDGRIIAAGYSGTGGKRGGVVLFDSTSLDQLSYSPLVVKEGGVSTVAFSHNDSTIAAGYNGDSGGGVVLFDIAAHSRVAESALPVKGTIGSLAFSNKDGTIAVGYGVSNGNGGGSGGVAFWNINLQYWHDLANAISRRKFNPSEWNRYFPDAPYPY